MDIDLKQFRDKFIEDATDLLVQLEIDLLALENDKTNKELIESVFRAMHTLKGVAGMYGFEKIAEYTHTLESIYDAIRDNEFPLSQEIFDITFKSVDHLRNLLKDVNFANEENQKKHHELITKIQDTLNKNENENETNPHKTKVSEQKQSTGTERTYYILLRTDESFIKRGIKILTIFKELSELGEYKIIDKVTSENTVTKEIEEIWILFLVTESNINEIEDTFLFIIDDCQIVKISDFNLFNKTENPEELKKIASETSILEETERLYRLNEEGLLENYLPENINEEKNEKQNEQASPKTLDTQTSKTATVNRISVEATKLDFLMYLVGELITVNSQLILSTRDAKFDSIRSYLEQVDKLSKQFRNNALDLRLVPIRDMAYRFQRLVRDLSKQLNKEINFQMQGTDTELDKSTIDLLAEPLIHIIRNAIDHGIEPPEIRKKNGKSPTGQINFFAYHQGNNVFINIQDDGAGIDPKKIKKKAIDKGFIQPDAQLTKSEIFDLIFLPGFSTVQNLTQISGRGVGMDVVRRKISEVRGEIEITSELGLGTSITIKLQQSISILDTMLVKVADLYFMLPLSDVEVCNQLSTKEIESHRHTQTLPYEDKLIPFINLHEITGFMNDKTEDNENKKETMTQKITTNKKVIVINKHDKKFAVVTDKIIGEHQAVLKPLGKTFQNQKLFTSASILADGEMAFMLNTGDLCKMIK